MKKILLILFLLSINNITLILSMDNAMDKNQTASKKQNTQDFIEKLCKEKAYKNKKIKDLLLRLFNNNSIEKIFDSLKKLSEKTSGNVKKIFHEALIEEFRTELRFTIHPGLVSFLSGADFKENHLQVGDLKPIAFKNIELNADCTQAAFLYHGPNQKASILDTNTKTELSRFDDIHEIRFNSANETFSILNNDSVDKTLLALNLDNGSVKRPSLEEYYDHNNYARIITFSPCEKYIAIGMKKNRIYLNDIKTKSVIHYDLDDPTNINTLMFSPLGKYLVTKVSYTDTNDKNKYKRELSIVRLESEGISKEFPMDELYTYEGKINFDSDEIFISPNDKYLLVTTISNRNKTARLIFNLKTKEMLLKLKLNNVRATCFCTDNIIAISDSDFKINFYNIIDQNFINTIKLNHAFGSLSKIKFNKDLTHMILGFNTDNQTADIYEPDDFCKLDSGPYRNCRLINFSDSWVVPKLSLCQLILLTKLIQSKNILNEIDTLNIKKYHNIYSSLPAQVKSEIQRYLVPNLLRALRLDHPLAISCVMTYYDND